MRNRSLILLICAAAVVAAGALAAVDRRGSDAAAATTRAVATAATSDFRVVLTARKGAPAGGAPSAEVTLGIFERSAAGWRRTGTHELGGAYFWKTLTGGRAVCRLELRTAGGRPRAVVRLLVTPSLGCGAVRTFPLTDER
jgi:hypothetical protein